MIPVSTYSDFINFQNIKLEPELRHFNFDLVNVNAFTNTFKNNIPIALGISTGKLLFAPHIPESFKELEQKILHDPKPKANVRKLKDATRKERELINYWEYNSKNRSDVFWSPKKDGRHIKPAQIFETWFEKRIIPPSEILDNNYGKNKKRNDTIEEIREKYLNSFKSDRGNYENLGTYYYKSPEAYRQFIKEIEDEGLDRPVPQRLDSEIYDPIDGFYHKI